MANKAKPGVEDGEKQSPTDLQEIQLQMNATTDEVHGTPFYYNNNINSENRHSTAHTIQWLSLMSVLKDAWM